MLITNSKRDSSTNLCVCVRAVEGYVQVSDRTSVEGLMGTSAILFVLPPGVTNSPNSVRMNKNSLKPVVIIVMNIMLVLKMFKDSEPTVLKMDYEY